MAETRQSWNEIIWFQKKQKALIPNDWNPKKTIEEIYWSVAPLLASSSYVCVLMMVYSWRQFQVFSR